MLINDFLPSPARRAFIRCYRIVHFEFDKAEKVPIKAYPPKPEQCLHFFLRDPLAFEQAGDGKLFQPPILLMGQRTALVKHLNGSSLLNVQIVFQPTAVFRLTGIPAYELTDQNLDAADVFSRDVQPVFQQLQAAGNYAELLRILDCFAQRLIISVRKDTHPLDFVSSRMIQTSGNISLDQLAKESCLCTKQFKRKFYERTGVNPKTYARIIRFNRAFNLKNRFPNRDWPDVAAHCGYFDYRHLAKDYKDFTALTPPELHLLENASPESVLGLTKSLYYNRYKAAF